MQKAKRMRINQSAGDRSFGLVNSTVLLLLCFITIVPVLTVALTSVTPMADIHKNPNGFFVIPSQVTFSHYDWLFRGSNRLATAFTITILRTVLGTALCLLLTTLTAYPLSKKYLPGRSPLMMLFYFTMLFSGGMIPTYLVVNGLGITNTFLALILPSAMNVYYMIIMRTFFQSIPEELDESARIDGATDVRILFTIILPLALPTMASVGLFYAVYHWNAFTDSIIYVGMNRNVWPLQMLLREIVVSNNVGELALGGLVQDPNRPNSSVIVSCTIMVSALPIMCLYPFLQRYFVKGLIVGSLKG